MIENARASDPSAPSVSWRVPPVSIDSAV